MEVEFQKIYILTVTKQMNIFHLMSTIKNDICYVYKEILNKVIDRTFLAILP